MGRRLRLASPTSVELNGWAASTPAMRRALVPLFAQSSGRSLARSERDPLPLTVMSGATAGTSAPSARRTPAVARTSAESRTPRTRPAPVASAPRISARWEMDLSPGTRTVPATVTLPQPLLEGRRHVRLLVAIFDDDRRLERQALLLRPGAAN